MREFSGINVGIAVDQLLENTELLQDYIENHGFTPAILAKMLMKSAGAIGRNIVAIKKYLPQLHQFTQTNKFTLANIATMVCGSRDLDLALECFFWI